MNSFHLISHHLCPYVQRAVIVLSEKNIEHRRTYIDLADKPDWFKQMSPLGRVPILETEISVLFESQIIAEYLDETTPGSLHPIDSLEKARHRSWIEFGSETLAGIGGFYSAKDADSFEQKRTALRAKFQRIEQEVSGSYFAGDTFHMIDGVWATIFRYFDVFDQIDDFGIMSDLDALQKWRQTLAARPSVINAPPEGYSKRLEQFLQKRNSYLTSLMMQDA
ncbi:glutathione S-transferase family protein [Lentilitoribacter sp. Alg239-R112]|uniref:glutathione S-transferase family protein n=1 Tax=Lentilitoribacter sp. Alg239-R112 TaxID=2305987 RepID=UPI0013A6A675|nr:glutathione S-transferase family protein [Lentilitoribacter sp. Alg239-R112]